MEIRSCDTLRPLDIKIQPFANSVHDTKYHGWCSAKESSFNKEI